MTSTSPFIAHLDTNYVPSSNEVGYIQYLVEERQKLVDALDKEIEMLAKRREEHATFVKKHSNLLSPIRRMPNDILSLIFLTCLPLNSHTRRPTKLSNDHPAVVLSHVCQRWRQLSLNTALLWTVIDIEIPSPLDAREHMVHGEMSWWERRLEAIDEITRTWISRSASCALTVSFSGGLLSRQFLGEGALSAASQNVSSIVDALCDVSSRWKSLYLSLAVDDDLSATNRFFTIPYNDVPLLENLAVNVTFNSLNFFRQPSSRLKAIEFSSGAGLAKAPSLRRLSIGRLWGSPLSLPINWAVLTEISCGAPFNSPDAAFPLALLARCPNLIRCSVTCVTQLNNTPTVPGSTGSAIAQQIPFINGEISLLRLQVLEIRGSEPPLGLASQLHLPSLRQLILLCPTQNPEESGVVQLIRKFGDNLTDLTLASWCFTEFNVTRVLERLPNVVSLRFMGAPPSRFHPGPQPAILDLVLDQLTPKYVDNADEGVASGVRSGCYCPNLKKFGCRINEGVRFSAAALFQFIASRRKTRSLGPGSEMVQRQNEALTPSPTNSEIAQLDSVVLAFPWRQPRKTVHKVLEEMGVDLEGMLLITAYRSFHSDHPWSMKLQDDLDPGLINHDDYVSVMGPLKQTLGGWVL